MEVLKGVAVLAVALALGACSRTAELEPGTVGDVTPAVYGNVAPQLPADWQKLKRADGQGAGVAFGCKPEECPDPGLIGYRALRVGGHSEGPDAVIPVSRHLLRAVENEVARTSGGAVSDVRVARVSAAGDVVEQTMVVSRKRTAYAIVRITRLPNEVRTVFAAGPTRADARRYMDIALAGAR